MKTTGHHACNSEGGNKFLLENGPFRAVYTPHSSSRPFLGSGYYFWDDNIEMALYWGAVHYGGDFSILEAELNCPEEEMLDLVGSRGDIKYFREIIKVFKAAGFPRDDWEIGKFIEFLKEIDSKGEGKGVFPYKIVRAVDNSRKESGRYRFPFVSTKRNFTFLDPRIIICLFEKSDRYIQSISLADKAAA